MKRKTFLQSLSAVAIAPMLLKSEDTNETQGRVEFNEGANGMGVLKIQFNKELAKKLNMNILCIPVAMNEKTRWYSPEDKISRS